MADRLNAAANAYSKAWSQKEKEDFSKGASTGGSLLPVKKTEPEDKVPMGQMADIEKGVEKMQAANTADPSLAEKLNRVAKARAKFYGEAK